MSVIASTVVGGLLAFQGVADLLEVSGVGARLTTRLTEKKAGDSSSSIKTARIVTNIFELIGQFALAVGMIMLGTNWMAVGGSAGFIAGLQEGLSAGLPWLIGGVSSLGTGVLMRQAID